MVDLENFVVILHWSMVSGQLLANAVQSICYHASVKYSIWWIVEHKALQDG